MKSGWYLRYGETGGWAQYVFLARRRWFARLIFGALKRRLDFAALVPNAELVCLK